MRRDSLCVPHRNQWRAQIDEQRGTPEPKTKGRRDDGRRRPKNRGNTESGGVDSCQPASLWLAPRTEILNYQDNALYRIGCSEAGRVPVCKILLGVCGHGGGREDLNQREKSMDDIVGVEASRIHRVPEPRPPDQKKHE